jgi:nucleoside kinase
MIYVTGHTIIDRIFHVNDFPKVNQSRPIQKYNIIHGGGAANTAYAYKKLGHDVSLITLLGNDFSSSGYEKKIKEDGIDISHAKFVNDQMPTAFLFNNEQKQQLMFFYWGASSKFPEFEIPELQITKKSVIHMATASPDFNKRISSKYSKDFLIVFDVGQDVVVYKKQDLQEIFQNTHLLMMNDNEASEVLKRLEIKNLKEILLLFPSIKIIVETRGPDGSYLLTREEEIYVPAMKPEKIVDTTGAGDSYKAAFIHSYLEGKDWKQCAQFATEISTKVIQKNGPQVL